MSLDSQPTYCNAQLASFCLDFGDRKAGCAPGAAGRGLVTLDGRLERGFLGGGRHDHLHDGGVCGRQSGVITSGQEQTKRTDDFLGCVGGELDEVVDWLTAKDELEL